MPDVKITPIPNGPLKAENIPNLTDDRGNAIEHKEAAFLCRCGLSKNKPFCDGSHKAAGFSTEDGVTNTRNKSIAYEGKVEGVDVTVTYTPMLCSHAAECQRLHKAVFDPSQRPWIQPEKGSLAGIRAVVFACPSGALRMSEGSGDPAQLGPDAGTIEVQATKDGPYAVRNVVLAAEFNGEGASEEKYVLCRCGHSGNKPFCDGSHRDKGWSDEDHA